MNEQSKIFRKIFYENYSRTQSEIDKNTILSHLKFRRDYIKSIIKKHFPKEKNIQILDLGCGSGAFLYFLKEDGYLNLEGVDASLEQVELSKELGLENIIFGDLLEVLKSKSGNSYDFIISFDVLEHFSKVEILEIVKEVYRVLKSDGKYLIHVPNGAAIFPGVVFYGDFTHETCFTHRSIRQIFNICGFKQIEYYEDEPVIHGFKSLVRHILWKIIRTIYKLIYMTECGAIEKIVLSQNILSQSVK